jgi:hypothetical protein
VQFTSVFVTVLQTQVLLGVVTGAAFFLILYGNVTLARRLATREARVVADDLPGLPSPEILQLYLGRLTLPVSVTLALFAGWLGTNRWELVLKALNGRARARARRCQALTPVLCAAAIGVQSFCFTFSHRRVGPPSYTLAPSLAT